MSTNITEQHLHAFEALTSGRYDNFALFNCFIDGSPGGQRRHDKPLVAAAGVLAHRPPLDIRPDTPRLHPTPIGVGLILFAALRPKSRRWR